MSGSNFMSTPPKILPIRVGQFTRSTRPYRSKAFFDKFQVLVRHERDFDFFAKGVDCRLQGGLLRREQSASDNAGQVFFNLR